MYLAITDTMPDSETANESSSRGIVYLDYDGVLNQGSSWRAVHHTLGTAEAADENYELHVTEEISFSEWGYRDAALWEGAPESKLRQSTEEVSLIDGIQETVAELHKRGFVVGVVSGGVKQLIEATVGDFDLDFIVANEVHVEDGAVIGEVSMDVTPATKADHYDDLAENLNVNPECSVTVGDSRDDFAPIQRGLNIAFNADDEATREAGDAVVNCDNFWSIVPVIDAWLTGLNE